jgi:hypothetical protein
MQTFGFFGAQPSQAMQPQTQPQQMQAPQQGAPQQAMDPQSQYLAQAIAQMGKQPQGSSTGLGENLLATALDQYALQQRQNGQGSAPQLTPDQLQQLGFMQGQGAGLNGASLQALAPDVGA